MEKEAVKQHTIIPFRELPLYDDFMFGHIMRNLNICRMFLEALLQKKIARIEFVTSQYDVTDSYFSHGIRVDVYLADEAGTVYCVEMQTTIRKNLRRRVRYYQSAIDRHHLQKGVDYIHLPETFIIFICTDDPFGYGLPIYEREMTLKNCEGSTYDDSSHAYFLNSAYTAENAEGEDPAIMEFLRCVRENDTEKENYVTPLMREVCDTMEEIRDDPAMEALYMQYQAKIMDYRREGLEEGRAEGLEEGIQGIVKALQGFSLSKENAIQSLQKTFGLDPDTAREKVEQYWLPN